MTIAEELYELYPRHVGRRAALKAFEAALKRLKTTERSQIHPDFWKCADNLTEEDYLLERVKLFAWSPAGKKGQMTPHPSTWANQSRYLDDIPEWFDWLEKKNDEAKKDPEMTPEEKAWAEAWNKKERERIAAKTR